MQEKLVSEKTKNENKPLFSILIPTWNNLSFLKLCVASVLKNSTFAHQILIHVNEGSDGTLQWVKEQGYEYTYSPSNIGICWALNLLRTKVLTDYILYLNDDMYVCPQWDKVLYDEITKFGDKNFFFSSTMIQARPNSGSCIISPANYGENVETFDEDKLLREYDSHKKSDWFGATSPPNIVHKDLWDLVGGYSIEFSPGMYSDPDFTAKLWMAGVRMFKGLSNSRYHFEARSTGRIKKNKGNVQFLEKWGITSSSFRRNLTKRGEDFDDAKIEFIRHRELRRDILRSKLKRLIYLFKDKNAHKLWDKKSMIEGK